MAFIVALFFYDELLDLVLGPYNDAVEQLGDDVDTKPYVNGAAGPLLLQLKLCGVAAIVVTSPYWLYQIWAFIVPGLHPQRAQVVAGSSRPSPARCSSPASRSATTCCPRASRC